MHFPSKPSASPERHAALAAHYFPFQFKTRVTSAVQCSTLNWAFQLLMLRVLSPQKRRAAAPSRTSSISSRCVCLDVQVTSSGACRGRRPRAPCLLPTTWTRESPRRPQTMVRRVHACMHACVCFIVTPGFPLS